MYGFEIRGKKGELVKAEIVEVFGFPEETSFRGGYEIRCSLEISVGNYSVKTANYFSSTGALYNFYKDLEVCFEKLSGTAVYGVYLPDTPFDLMVAFDAGKVNIDGMYQDDPSKKNRLFFEFESDQSYFNNVLFDLKSVAYKFGGNKGITE